MTDTIPTSILDTLIEDLLFLSGAEQAYRARDHDGNAVTVETYDEDGEIDGRYTVTFNIEKQEN